MAHNWLQN
uniref:Uncharacterized protein n=1 Tax=Anguilla anguilla TaxID=7936 RepID=A0A0E9PUB8_ANGAN